MPTLRDTLPRCANCGVEIPWRPAVYRGATYCCGGCVQGGPCYCSYDLTSHDPARGHEQRAALDRPRSTRGTALHDLETGSGVASMGDQ